MRAKRLKSDYEEVDGVLHYQGLTFVLEVIQTELISRHHNDQLADISELTRQKSYLAGNTIG